MVDKVNVICLYWVGEFRGREFNTSHVNRLRKCVDKHVDRSYEFYCLTNDMNADVDAVKIELEYAWPGWWSKMELHRPDLPEGRTLYLDLDSHVIRALQPILDFEGDLVMFKTREPKRKIDNPPSGSKYKYQAATMLFTPGKMADLYTVFCHRPDHWMSLFRSDQDFMGHFIPNQPTFPDSWMCKLSQCIRTEGPPSKDTIIVTGQPKKREHFHNYRKYVPWLEGMARG